MELYKINTIFEQLEQPRRAILALIDSLSDDSLIIVTGVPTSGKTLLAKMLCESVDNGHLVDIKDKAMQMLRYDDFDLFDEITCLSDLNIIDELQLFTSESVQRVYDESLRLNGKLIFMCQNIEMLNINPNKYVHLELNSDAGVTSLILQ